MPITSLNDLEALADSGAVVTVRRDAKAQMASIDVNGHPFMSGNFWDFKPECHGGFHYDLARIHGRWSTPDALAGVIRTYLEAAGAGSVVIRNEAYDWNAFLQSEDSRKGKAA